MLQLNKDQKIEIMELNWKIITPSVNEFWWTSWWIIQDYIWQDTIEETQEKIVSEEVYFCKTLEEVLEKIYPIRLDNLKYKVKENKIKKDY
jgi:hypothetical protein